MKFKVQPNRTMSEKKKIVSVKKPVPAFKEKEVKDKDFVKEGSIPTKFQFDDDYDNWFPWETY